MFDKITISQKLWYMAQFDADDKEQFELFRDIAEYNASFWNPEGVNEIRRAREKAFKVSDKDFAKQLEQTFGRKLNVPMRKEGLEGFPLPPMDSEPKRFRMSKNVNPETYLGTELDEVKFVPLRKK